jgi:hypothetical protein
MGTVMSRITVDAATRARLHNLDEFLVFCDESGRTLGYFHPGIPPDSATTSKIKSPIPDEEIERRRKDRTGIPFSDVLNRLKDR